jgi:hypothetical protein
MIISRQNNKIHYTYQPLSNTYLHSNKYSLSPVPLINRTPLHQVPIHKWYIVNKYVVDHIIDTYVKTFYDFLDETPRYNVYLDEYQFRECMIKNLYNSSQNKNKNFI